MEYLTKQELDRFKTKYVVNSKGCWVWQDRLDKDGYGDFYLRGANRRAHRVAYYSVNGEIEKGNVVNHVCRNTSCVNPQHLQSTTAKENSMKDSSGLGYINSQKTTCPKGHTYDKTVTYAEKTQRVCTICYNEAKRIAKKKQYHEGKQSLSV